MNGRLPEWFKGSVLKTEEGLWSSASSNLAPSFDGKKCLREVLDSKVIGYIITHVSRACNSVGRVIAFQAICRRFESDQAL